jgi:hypothetical protein
MYARKLQARSLPADNAPSARILSPLASFGPEFAALLAQLRAAQRRVDTTTGDEADEAVHEWATAIEGLLSLVASLAGPAPSAVRLPDGSLVIASVDAFDNVEEQQTVLCVVPADQVVSL